MKTLSLLKFPMIGLRQLLESRREYREKFEAYEEQHGCFPTLPLDQTASLNWEELMAFFKAIVSQSWLKEAVADAVSKGSKFDEEEGEGVLIDRVSFNKLASLASWYPVYLGRPKTGEAGLKFYDDDKFVVSSLRFASVQLISGESLNKVISDYIMAPLERYNIPLRHGDGRTSA